MIIQTYNHLGRDWDSAIKITSFKLCNCDTETETFDVELTINRYTDSTCAYDIEQFTKTFSWLTWTDIGVPSISDLEDLLLTDDQFIWSTKA